MHAAPQHTAVNPHAAFDAMVLGLPAVDGVPFSHPIVTHEPGDRWFSVSVTRDEYNAIDDRIETRTRVALCVREPDESHVDGWDVDAWGARPATPVEIQLMARVAVAAYAAYGGDVTGGPADMYRIRLA